MMAWSWAGVAAGNCASGAFSRYLAAKSGMPSVAKLALIPAVNSAEADPCPHPRQTASACKKLLSAAEIRITGASAELGSWGLPAVKAEGVEATKFVF